MHEFALRTLGTPEFLAINPRPASKICESMAYGKPKTQLHYCNFLSPLQQTQTKSQSVTTKNPHFLTLGMSHPKPNLPSKICLVCNRPFTWRKKWSNVWEEVKYCSEKCRRSKDKIS
jgi:hypothetical protein